MSSSPYATPRTLDHAELRSTASRMPKSRRTRGFGRLALSYVSHPPIDNVQLQPPRACVSHPLVDNDPRRIGAGQPGPGPGLPEGGPGPLLRYRARERDRPVTAEAIITKTAATAMAMSHRTQSIPGLPFPPNAV